MFCRSRRDNVASAKVDGVEVVHGEIAQTMRQIRYGFGRPPVELRQGAWPQTDDWIHSSNIPDNYGDNLTTSQEPIPFLIPGHESFVTSAALTHEC